MRDPITTSLRAKLGTAAVLIALAAVLWQPSWAQKADDPFTYDGLKQVKSKAVDRLYTLPGATLEAYDSVLLDPVGVAFHKSFERDFPRVSAKDMDDIRARLASEFTKVFKEVLEENGGYPMVQAPGPSVLRVTAAIVNLYVQAPDQHQTGRSHTYSDTAGDMTLVAELRDSETNAVLARVADRQSGDTFDVVRWQNSATNTAEARKILKGWAETLRKGLDAARATPPQ